MDALETREAVGAKRLGVLGDQRITWHLKMDHVSLFIWWMHILSWLVFLFANTQFMILIIH